MCEKCNCDNCKNQRDILFVSEIDKKFELDISCHYAEKDITNILNITATTADEFLQQLLTNFDIPLVQMCYANAKMSDNVSHYFAMCSDANKATFFLHLTDDCNLTDENEQYLKIFSSFIKTYYKISDNMFNEFYSMINTHTIKFTDKQIEICLK